MFNSIIFIISHKGRVNDKHLVQIFNKLNIINISEIDARLENKKVIDKLEKDDTFGSKAWAIGTPAFIIKMRLYSAILTLKKYYQN